MALITPAELEADLKALEVEAMGWLPLSTAVEGGQVEEGEQAYLHVGDPQSAVITVIGVPEVGMAEMNVLLVGW